LGDKTEFEKWCKYYQIYFKKTDCAFFEVKKRFIKKKHEKQS
jgi:hypothetical protein